VPSRQTPILLVAVTAVLAAATLASGAGATKTAFPGKNGRILFNDQYGYLDLVNANGTGVVRLAQTRASDQLIGAAWSPDGQSIVYSKAGSTDADIFTIRPDGSDQREVTFSRGADIDPTWSADGTRIAFETNRNGNSDIYSVNADGSGAAQLTSSPLKA
jgi:Tol biopolymer transport system component